MSQVKIWVMITDPLQPTAETKTFTGITIEDCVRELHNYLDSKTGPGTRAEIIQSGYINSEVQHGIQR
jgi:hypothetical protein